MATPESTKKLRLFRRSNKLCLICGVPVISSLHCVPCLQLAKERSSKARSLRKLDGKCTVCFYSFDSEEHKQRCIEAGKFRRQLRKNNGFCSDCGKLPPKEFFMSCSNCLEKHQTRRDIVKESVFSHYGRNCMCCDEDQLEFLQIDHIDGGGVTHRKSIRKDFYTWLKDEKFPVGFQTLCANCNMGKRLCNGVCPKHGKILGKR